MALGIIQIYYRYYWYSWNRGIDTDYAIKNM